MIDDRGYKAKPRKAPEKSDSGKFCAGILQAFYGVLVVVILQRRRRRRRRRQAGILGGKQVD